jgi:hypothetical protein
MAMSSLKAVQEFFGRFEKVRERVAETVTEEKRLTSTYSKF